MGWLEPTASRWLTFAKGGLSFCSNPHVQLKDPVSVELVDSYEGPKIRVLKGGLKGIARSGLRALGEQGTLHDCLLLKYKETTGHFPYRTQNCSSIMLTLLCGDFLGES